MKLHPNSKSRKINEQDSFRPLIVLKKVQQNDVIEEEDG